MVTKTISKDLNYYLSLPYSIQLTPDEDGWFVEIPALPGCMSHGDTQSQALERIEEAKELWLTSRLEHSDPIPEPDDE